MIMKVAYCLCLGGQRSLKPPAIRGTPFSTANA